MKRLNNIRYKDFYTFSLILILFGLFLDRPKDILSGLINIVSSPSILLSDYMEIGGLGASFINAGFMLLISLFLAEKSGAAITGALVAGIFNLIGFSFFGKNILNSIPLMIGV